MSLDTLIEFGYEVIRNPFTYLVAGGVAGIVSISVVAYKAREQARRWPVCSETEEPAEVEAER